MKRTIVFLFLISLIFYIMVIPTISFIVLSHKIINLYVKEALDIQQSREHEEKLAQYIQTIEYELEVVSKKDLK